MFFKMNLKLFFFLVLFCNVWSFQLKLYAGQISVINPSSGSAASGVINVASMPGSISQSSTNIGSLFSHADNKYFGITKDTRLTRILSIINGTNVSLFSEAETKDALDTIDVIMKISDLDSYTLGILRQEIIKLKQNLD